MISVKEALEIIIKEVEPLGTEEASILDSLGRVVGEDIRAPRPNPPWDNSAMDGYAVLSEDTSGATPDRPSRLKVIYDLPAGQTPKGPVEKGSAVRIMTGAPVPEGADSVVMVEKTERLSGGEVLVLSSVRKGENIRKKGEDFREGDVVVRKGSVVRPAEVAMLATVGVAKVRVYRRPVVAVVSTGDELVDIGEPLQPGKISDSNGYTLASLVAGCGATARRLGIARDNKESLHEKLREAAKADCIISSGGVSVGDYDFVKGVLEEMGSTMRFWKVAMKPGKPLAFGVIGGKPAFGLPGNPISSIVAFEQFVRPVLLKLAGRTSIHRAAVDATLTADIKTKPGRMNFIRAELRIVDSGFTATPLEGQGSSIISSMVRANCFVIVPADSSGLRKGDKVRVQPFDDSIFLSSVASY